MATAYKQEVLDTMLKNRGYKKLDTTLLPSDPTLVAVWKEPNDAIMVVFDLTTGLKADQVSVKEMRHCHSYLESNAITHCLMISKSGLNHYTIKEVKSLEHLHVETFLAADLQMNITDTCLYQPHRKLSDEEASAIIKRYGGVEKLWRIQVNDRVVKYFGWRVGDIIEIGCGHGGFEFDYGYSVVIPAIV